MFTVYHSNQLDLLKQLIAALIAGEPLKNPFEDEIILVQSPGMAQWLQIQLAQTFGIAANITFPLPATFIWKLFTQVIPDIPQESAFTKEAMTWKLMGLLPAMTDQEAFTPLAHYLREDGDRRKHYQLATCIADLFDQYLVYRPEWLQIWERGERVAGLDEAQSWQAPLWVALCDYTRHLGQPAWHRANLYQQVITTLNNASCCPPGLPRRIFICGISALPPVYLDALQALGRHIDVHLMFTNPCRYYWGDIQDYSFLAKLQSRKRRRLHLQNLPSIAGETAQFRDSVAAVQLFSTQGEQNLSNPLLASWGKLGRDHLYLLAQHELLEVDAFVDLDDDTLLHRVQRDILELEDHAQLIDRPERLQGANGKFLLEAHDRSISIHVCHSPQREVEVLHDQLLDRFAADPTLTPRDVVVMVADIDSYTPFIRAVFGSAPTERYLPFAISDRSARQAHPVIQAFLSLLALPESRFSAEQVLALLEVPALAARFAIDEVGLRRLRRWVAESGIRWGLDDDNVREMELPATGQHTWHFGLTRMLLGYAMDSQYGEWQGVLPYDESSGTLAELAGYLAELLAQLHYWRRRLKEEHTLGAWLPLCREMLACFFVQTPDIEPVLVLIEQQWIKLINYGLDANYLPPISLTILRDELTSRLEHERISQRFLAGKINFCTLMPMRSIPFRVVCLLGMNDGVYPRTLLPLGFDLMANNMRKGDRSRRDDDRYLFLEALISAQDQLYISYIGRAMRDDARRYPSVLVSELIEYIAQSHYLSGDETRDVDDSVNNVMRQIQIWHPRVPFAAENFVPDPDKQSYAAEWLPAARRTGEAPPAFVSPLTEPVVSSLTLEELMRFYRHPVRAFFQMRLGVNFMVEEHELSDEEPFTLDGLTGYQLNHLLLNQLIEGGDPDILLRRIRAEGRLPFGAFGDLYWQRQQGDMADIAQRVVVHRQAAHALEVDCWVAGIHFSGWLHQVQDNGLLRWRPAVLNAVDGMLLWIEHLAYCLSGGERESWKFGRQNTTWCFAPLTPEEARQALIPLFEGYRQGMAEPLLLLPKTGWAWLDCCFNRDKSEIDWCEDTQEKARRNMLLTWQGDQRAGGENTDPYLQRIMRVPNEHQWQQIQQSSMRFYLPWLMRNRQNE